MRISDFVIAGLVIGNCRYIDRTDDVQLTTSSDVLQIKLDSIEKFVSILTHPWLLRPIIKHALILAHTRDS